MVYTMSAPIGLSTYSQPNNLLYRLLAPAASVVVSSTQQNVLGACSVTSIVLILSIVLLLIVEYSARTFGVPVLKQPVAVQSVVVVISDSRELRREFI